MNCTQVPRIFGPRRSGLGVVVAAHALLALLLMQDMPRVVMPSFAPPIAVQVLPDHKAPEEPETPLPRSEAPAQPRLPMLPIDRIPDTAETTSIPKDSGVPRDAGPSAPMAEAPGAPLGGDTPEVSRLQPQAPGMPRISPRPAVLGLQACAPRGEDYPQPARRAEVSGTTRLRVTMNAAGSLVRSEVIASAGPTREHRLLDKVALEKLAGCSFKAGVDENGNAVGGTFEIDYIWKLGD